MGRLHTGVWLFVTFWMQPSQTAGLGEMAQQNGHHVHQTLPLLIFCMDKVYSTPVPNVGTLKARITAALATVTTEMLESTLREIEFRLYILQATKGAHVEIYE